MSRMAGRARPLLLVAAVVITLAPPAAEAGVAVSVFPGDSIQGLVNANPEGTTFLIKAGVHRRQQVIPKSRDSFVGEPGAVLSGEGVTEFAFGPGGADVTVRGLVIENYVPPLQRGVVRGASGWVVERNEVRWNSGVGIAAGPGWQVRDNHVHHQGQLGMSAAGEGIVVEGNEIAFNNTDNIDPYWEAGGTKFANTTNLVVRNNYVHDNNGPGLWTDGNNIYTLYQENRVTNNFGPGIFHEISYDAVIRNNVVERNGFGYTGWIDGAGILVGDSPNVEVYGNTVRYNNDGIAGKQTGRGSGDYGPYQLRNLWVHDNLIVMSVGQTGVVRMGGLQDPVWSDGWNNRFDHNTYTLGAADMYYAWEPWYLTTPQWKAAGQDPHGAWVTPTPPGAPTARQCQPGAGWIRVSWTAPAVTGGVAIDDYLIDYRPEGAGAWMRFGDGASTEPRADVTPLTNGVRYQFRVAARNAIGVGPWSHVLEMTTGVPTRPRNPVASTGNKQIRLTWHLPADSNGADITDYVIQYRDQGTTGWITFRDGRSTARSATVTPLDNGTTYQFRVAAKNARGLGVWSLEVEAEPGG